MRRFPVDDALSVKLGELPLVLTVPEAGRLLRISRGSAYEAARRGEIPTLRIGSRVVVPTQQLLAILGADSVADTEQEAEQGRRPLTSWPG
jgi:excisionase family DNA binding protein